MIEPLVKADKLSKTYRLYPSPWDRLREMVTGQPRHRAIHALQNVSFDLRAGESLGIVGENGAGKSTLLKILSGVSQPTTGRFHAHGRVASLLELGMGFHPELSGQQNIRLTAAILGFSAEEVDEKTPQIVAFSELGDFIDRPIKTYSSGMAMRLGFAIAAQVDPEVLIVDEALSVGDGYFQKKCMDKVRSLLEGGCTFLFCSHAMYYVSSFCDRALWLRDGEPAALGPVAEVVREYESYLLARRRRVELDEAGQEAEAGAKDTSLPSVGSPAKISDIRLTEGEEDGTYQHGSRWGVEVSWRSEDPELAFHLGIGITRADGVQVCSFLTLRSDMPPMTGQEEYRLSLQVPSLPIYRGELDIYVFLADEVGLHVYDQAHLPNALVVDSDDYDYGLVHIDHSWNLETVGRAAHEPRPGVPLGSESRNRPASVSVSVDR